MPIAIPGDAFDCKHFVASMRKDGKKNVCKICANLLAVQKLCKTKSRGGICAKSVQNFRRVWRPLYAIAGCMADNGATSRSIVCAVS